MANLNIKVSKYVKEKIGRDHSDFALNFFSCGGNGGSKLNTSNMGVRITDKVTGLSCECREERSQLQNKSRAFLKLVDKLIEFYQNEEFKTKETFINNNVIRTYDEKLGLVIDHKTGKKYNYKKFLDGKIDLANLANL